MPAADVSAVMLTRRFGDEVRSPTNDDFDRAVHELYDGALPHVSKSDLDENPDVKLAVSTVSRGTIVLRIDQRALATLEQWDDDSQGVMISPPLTIRDVPRDQALSLWTQLAEGKFTTVLKHFAKR